MGTMDGANWRATPLPFQPSSSSAQYLACSGNPGSVIASGFVSASNQVKASITRDIALRYPITLNAAGAVRNLGTLTLLAQGIGASSTMQAAITWDEVH